MYTFSYTLYASRGSKCAPSCFGFPGLLNIESYDNKDLIRILSATSIWMDVITATKDYFLPNIL